jgi:hypothetical protein
VIEANFHPHSELELDKLRGRGDRVVEVHCACPAEVAVARYNARHPRHEAHGIKTVTLTNMDKYDRPVGIGSLITVDTTVPVDVAFVAAEVRHKACISNHVTVRPPRRRHPHRAARRATRWSPRPSSASLPAGRGSGTLAHSGR